MGSFYKGFDFGSTLEDIVQAAREFGEKMKESGPEMGPFWFDACGRGPGGRHGNSQHFFYPPVNSYTARDGSLVFEFALAGLDESAVSVTFQGDDLILSAKVAAKEDEAEDTMRFSRRGFRPRNIDRQRYRVPAEDYAQELAKAVFKNGVLTVTIPPKEPEGEGIKIEIVKEGK